MVQFKDIYVSFSQINNVWTYLILAQNYKEFWTLVYQFLGHNIEIMHFILLFIDIPTFITIISIMSVTN